MNAPVPPRPASPWSGSTYAVRHRWQLDTVTTLAQAADALRDIAAELAAAHEGGWWLTEPVRSGHLLAERASRRRRPPPPGAPAGSEQAPRLPDGWRLRVVDESPQPGDVVLDLAAARSTPTVRWHGTRLAHAGGPALPEGLLAELHRQVTATGLDDRVWGFAPARVGRAGDLVAEGTALRIHAVDDGRLVRTAEALSFMHAADGASTLLAAASAYRRLARAVELMRTHGGRLMAVDEGLLHVAYGRVA